MESPKKDNEETSNETLKVEDEISENGASLNKEEASRPPAKRRMATAVIEISDTESDDSDVCAVNTYRATAEEVKRIRGEENHSTSSSSSGSSSEYSSDSESPWEDDSIVLNEPLGSKKIVKARLNRRADRTDDPSLNPRLKTEEIKEKLRKCWQEQTDFTTDEVSLCCEPFPVCQIHKFLENADMINNMVDDMNTLEWSRRRMDLYEYQQTDDLSTLTWQRGIRGMYHLLKTDLMEWVRDVSGEQIESVSAACSLYGPGDRLLAHDDMMPGRKIAFILYLCPWGFPGDSESGALELLACDEKGQPERVTRAIRPANNTLVLFKVSPKSYHQVSEVLSLEVPRLSINGWFHTKEEVPLTPAASAEAAPPADAVPSLEETPSAESPMASTKPVIEKLTPHSEVVLLNEWLEATYMSPRARGQIQEQMERASEVCLRDFLLPQRCKETLDLLAHPDVKWQECGPLNRRRWHRCVVAGDKSNGGRQEGASWDAAGEPLAGAALLKLVTSVGFVRALAACTGLALRRHAPAALHKWTPGCYELIPSKEEYAEARLEAVYYLGVPRPKLAGGQTLYIAPEEGSSGGPAGDAGGALAPSTALVTVPPRHNALSLVYCDPGAASYTHYLSKLSMDKNECFYILRCTYYE